ncbi:MAG TPA: helix-turn-helix domain-containing protein [Patescibacteria group bacterium]|nr:helix-turn-helix domain-containing protein [Patescibacteria group bacterium]
MGLNAIIRLSVSEASRLFGVSQRTIRRAITKQEVTYVVVQGRYKINFESLLKWSQRTTTARHKRDLLGLGQYVAQWKIRNKLFSPNPNAIIEPKKDQPEYP